MTDPASALRDGIVCIIAQWDGEERHSPPLRDEHHAEVTEPSDMRADLANRVVEYITSTGWSPPGEDT